jgi:hypothetical protein
MGASVVKQWDQLGYGEEIIECPIGNYVLHSDYLALQAALREALDEWQDWHNERHAQSNPRIAELRKFLDDK